MRVTFLLTQSLDSPGGGGRYLPLARALSDLGYQVTILALHHDYGACTRREFDEDGVHVRYVAQMHVRKTGSRKAYFSPVTLLWITSLATWRLTWAALRTPADLIQICKAQPMNGLAAWIVHRLRGTPVLLDSDDYEAVNNRFTSRWQQRLVAWFEDWLPSFSAAVTVGNTFIGSRYQSLGYDAQKIVLLPNGADPGRFAILEAPDLERRLQSLRTQYGLPAGGKTVVYVGSMSLTSHAVDLLLEAFALVHRQEPDARLLLVGGGEDLDHLRTLTGQLNLDHVVCFTGRVPRQEVPLYYRLGRVTADPMRASLQAASSLSLKLGESIAAGVPCVTAAIGDRPERVGQAGIAVPPDDAAALARGLLTVLTDDEAEAAMRRAAHQMRDRQWWTTRAQTVARLYDSIA